MQGAVEFFGDIGIRDGIRLARGRPGAGLKISSHPHIRSDRPGCRQHDDGASVHALGKRQFRHAGGKVVPRQPARSVTRGDRSHAPGLVHWHSSPSGRPGGICVFRQTPRRSGLAIFAVIDHIGKCLEPSPVNARRFWPCLASWSALGAG